MIPQGRITHQSGLPISTSNNFIGQVLYYTPYIGDKVPLYDGASMNRLAVPELPILLDGNTSHTAYLQAGHLFDLFLINTGGSSLAIGTGPSWTSGHVRGTGAGSSELERFSGLLVNKYPILSRFGTGAGDTITVPARQATYLGSLFATDNGYTKFQMKPPAGPGGSSNVLGYWNAYNRETVNAYCQDSISDWGYGSTTKRFARGSDAFRIWWIDGLAHSFVQAEYKSSCSCSGAAAGALTVSPVLDAAVPLPVDAFYGMLSQGATNSPIVGMEVTGKDFTTPQLGLHYYQAMEEAGDGVTVTIYSANWSTLSVTLKM